LDTEVSSILASNWQNRNGPVINAIGTVIPTFSLYTIWGFTPAKIYFGIDNTRWKLSEVPHFGSISVLVRYGRTFGAHWE